MANIKSTEKLKAMFQQSKERKEKERQQQRLEKQQQYQQLCKEADRLLKEALQDEKRKRMEQLQALVKKTSQKRNKQHYINIDNNRWIENDKYAFHYSREELETLCPNCINWKKWDEVVNQTKQQLKDMGCNMKLSKDNYTLKKKRNTVLWTYSNGSLLKEYTNCSAAAREFGVGVTAIYQYMTKKLTIKGITFSNKPLE